MRLEPDAYTPCRALVYWPDTHTLTTIARQTVFRATVEGAVLIADEADIMAPPIRNNVNSNPRRVIEPDDGA